MVRETKQMALGAALAVTLGACATAPGPFERHAARAVTPEQQAPSVAASHFCPVVVTNRTDQRLDASYATGGVTSVLGLIPAGRSLSFAVSCDSGAIEAFAVADDGFLGGGSEYRIRARVRPEGATALDFSTTDQIR